MTHPADVIRRKARDRAICTVIPVYNNAGTIGAVIEGVFAYCGDVIVVDDGSDDGTADILSSYGDRISIVTHSRNRGKGAALSTAFKAAREAGFATAITIDADGQHRPEDLPVFIDAATAHPHDIIIGVRDLTKVDINAKSSFANKFSNFWFMVHTLRRIPDTQTGFRAYPLRRKLTRLPFTSRYEAELSLLVCAAWRGIDIRPVPINVFYPSREQRISHFRPVNDFIRISVLNTVQTPAATLYGLPAIGLRKLWRLLTNREYRLFTHRHGVRRDAALTMGRLLRSTYGALFFTTYSTLVLTPLAFLYFSLHIPTEKSRLRFHKILRQAARYTLFRLPGSKFTYQNPAGESFRKPAVVICNHQSPLDLMAMMSVSEKFIFLTNDRVWHNFCYGPIIRRAEFFPTSGGIENLVPKLRRMIERGYSVVIFPEGTRNPEGHISRFKQGAFHIASTLQTDIVGFVIHGAGRFMSKHDLLFRRNPITLRCTGRTPFDVFRNQPPAKAASLFRHETIESYSHLAAEKEDLPFFAATIRYKYAWRGRHVAKRARQEIKSMLRKVKTDAGWGRIEMSTLPDGASTVRLLNAGIGTEALALALLNPHIRFEALECQSLWHEILSSIPGAPDNLSVLAPDTDPHLITENHGDTVNMLILRSDADKNLYPSLTTLYLKAGKSVL